MVSSCRYTHCRSTEVAASCMSARSVHNALVNDSINELTSLVPSLLLLLWSSISLPFLTSFSTMFITASWNRTDEEGKKDCSICTYYVSINKSSLSWKLTLLILSCWLVITAELFNDNDDDDDNDVYYCLINWDHSVYCSA